MKSLITALKEKRALRLYFIGIIIFIIGLLLPISSTVRVLISIIATILSGYHVMLEGIDDTIKETVKKKRFTPNTHILMTLAAIGAIFLGEAVEAALLIFIFAGAHFLEEYVEGKSKREITKLIELNPTEARLINNEGKIEVVSIDKLKIGDRLQVVNGAQVPTDGIILNGSTSIDESTINGESIPREKNVGDIVFGSTINGTGTFTMRVSKDSKDTVFSKILTMVEESQNNLSPTADFIKRFEPHYVNGGLVIFLALIIFSPMFLGWTLTETISRSLVFLVSASPCALAVAAIPATLAGISSLAKQGILFKGGNFLSNLINLKAVAFDKTGTLTEGKPKVVDFYFNPELDGESFRNTLVAMEKQSNHPLANAIVNKFEIQKVDYDIKVENELGTGLSATYQGESYRIAKPSAFKIVSQEWIEKQENFEKEGKTVVFIAVNDKVEGLIAIQDTPQKTAISAIQYLNKNQIKTIMITGDAVLTGKAIGKQLGVRDVQANVMPDEKAKIINENKEKYGPAAMIGDGVNDAPALAVADVGIAMGDGTDVAIETADVVLMNNDLGNFVSAHKTSKRLKNIVTQNIIFALLVVLFLVYISLWKNTSVVLSITLHEGSTRVVLLNSLRLLLPNKKDIEGEL
ncbi:metal-transporting ATPase [Streptococcus parauberis]|nr:metal-transporting ATPase [Streptococcus parauberis]